MSKTEVRQDDPRLDAYPDADYPREKYCGAIGSDPADFTCTRAVHEDNLHIARQSGGGVCEAWRTWDDDETAG